MSGAHASTRRVAPAAVAATVLTGMMVLSAGIGAFGLGAGPPPTPVPPSGSLSPYPQTLHTPPVGVQAPHIRADAAVVVNAKTGQVLFGKSADASRAIASLTKVMTALVTVKARKLDHVVAVSGEAAAQTGSTLGLEAGERISVRSLLYALLLQSSNDAATALADDISGTTGAFVDRMNLRARRLGLTRTSFASPNGLDDRGRSTATDLATLTRAVIAVPELVAVMGTKFAVIANPNGPARHIQNRNAMLWLYPGTFGVKTGFTSEAGECLITAAIRGDRTLVSVVLGDAGDAMFDDSAALLNYGFGAFRKVPVVRSGQPVGSLTVGGAAVEASATATLLRLVRSDRIATIRIGLRPRAGLALPVAAGDVVGEVVISAQGSELGRVPAVALRAVTAPDPSPTAGPPTGPGPERGAEARPLDVLASLLQATFGRFV